MIAGAILADDPEVAGRIIRAQAFSLHVRDCGMAITQEKKPIIVQREVGSDIKIDCTKLGFGCIIETYREAKPQYFVTAASPTIRNDPALDELTEQLNSLIAEAYDAREDRNSKLGIMATPRGFMLAWKYDELEKLPPAGPDQRMYDTADMTAEEIEAFLWPSAE